MSPPRLRLKKHHEAAVKAGNPWIFAGDIIDSSELALLQKGELVEIYTAKDAFIGVGYYNQQAPLCCRVLTQVREPINGAFFERRLREAVAKKAAMKYSGYYRVIHSEADGIPGLVIDCFLHVAVVQIGTAGIARCWPEIRTAIERVLAPKGMVVRSDAPAHESVEDILRLI